MRYHYSIKAAVLQEAVAIFPRICYNGANGEPPSERDRDSGGRSLRDFEFRLTL